MPLCMAVRCEFYPKPNIINWLRVRSKEACFLHNYPDRLAYAMPRTFTHVRRFSSNPIWIRTSQQVENFHQFANVNVQINKATVCDVVAPVNTKQCCAFSTVSLHKFRSLCPTRNAIDFEYYVHILRYIVTFNLSRANGIFHLNRFCSSFPLVHQSEHALRQLASYFVEIRSRAFLDGDQKESQSLVFPAETSLFNSSSWFHCKPCNIAAVVL